MVNRQEEENKPFELSHLIKATSKHIDLHPYSYMYMYSDVFGYISNSNTISARDQDITTSKGFLFRLFVFLI